MSAMVFGVLIYGSIAFNKQSFLDSSHGWRYSLPVSIKSINVPVRIAAPLYRLAMTGCILKILLFQ